MHVDTEVPKGDVDIAQIGSLLADSARCRVLMALDDGRALPASRLAEEAGVAPSTASKHLAKLTEAGLLDVQTHGRHRYYRLSGPLVGDLLETLTQVSPPRPVRSLREGNRAAALRAARTCYDHLAGKLGVAIMDRLVERDHLVPVFPADPDHPVVDGPTGWGRDVDYKLTPSGQEFFEGVGVGMHSRRRRPLVRYCVDWSEQRHHLAGGLGWGLLDRLTSLSWIKRAKSTRSVVVTDQGRKGLAEWFGLSWPL
jgi:DNA-binding transcriptional ArsR family regulator